jgi:hypothetical protein
MSAGNLFQVLLNSLSALFRWFIPSKPGALLLKLLFGVLAAVATVVVVLLAITVAEPDSVKAWMSYLGDKSAKFSRFLPASLPEKSDIKKAIWLDQNWSNRDRFWFHHTSQGTATIPVSYDWFISLEQPEFFFLRNPKLLSDSGYLGKFGFIPSPTGKLLSEGDIKRLQKYGYREPKPDQFYMEINRKKRDEETGFPDNRDNLPVGFAKLDRSDNPVDVNVDRVGFTCAACHTGHLEYKGVSLRFDGGPAMLDLGKLEAAIGLSIAYTLKIPLRFCRFADRVMARENQRAGDLRSQKRGTSSEPCSSKRKQKLKAELEQTVAYLKIRLDWRTAILDNRKTFDVSEGFGRLDALNRIGNQVFFENFLPRPLVECAVKIRLAEDREKKRSLRRKCAKVLSLPEDAIEDIPMPGDKLAGNFRRIDAPVSFPPLWGVPWFSWAQYDASVINELVRNAGEALGVSAIFHSATGAGKPTYSSSIKLENIYWMEKTLRGKHPLNGRTGFKGLRAPKWPAEHFPGDPNWTIDRTLAAKGRELYRMHCVECHLAPVNDPEFDQMWPNESIWSTENSSNAIGAKNWIEINGQKYLNLVQKPVKHIGTDPQQALVLSTRKIHIPSDLGLKPIEILNRDHPNNNCGLPDDPELRSIFALALMGIVDKTIDRWFEDHPEYRAKEKVMRGPRPNCPNPLVFRHVVQQESSDANEDSVGKSWSYLNLNPDSEKILNKGAKDKIAVRPVYRARPLDGVWATAPYLHNGSVPNLAEMLKPASERIKSFCVGSRQFDPIRVGLKLEFPEIQKRSDRTKKCSRGLTRVDTNTLGSSNAGHSFKGGYRKDKKYPLGIVGPSLNSDQRKQLLEYLKTL